MQTKQDQIHDLHNTENNNINQFRKLDITMFNNNSDNCNKNWNQGTKNSHLLL